jgi:DNA mismatch repair protein MutL
MPSIAVLPVHVQNKIAAGEVIERPASVVKELLENAIDAGSTSIEIAIERAGRKLIRVADNGIGMSREDAVRAFERYATSKIRCEDDLCRLQTLGFRGEGLAAIAAVSRVVLKTAEHNAMGIQVTLSGGVIEDTREAAAFGTSIEVRDLFYNIPARRKFLKSDQTENFHIIDVVTCEAIAHYALRFSLHTDGSELILAPAAVSLRERIMQIYGKEFVDGLLEVTAREGGCSLHLFLSSPSMVRSSRTNQYIFVNRRPVKDSTVSQAIYRAYEGMLSAHQHPVFFAFLTLDPEQVDCNVHPTKREVRFRDKSRIFRMVSDAARGVLLHSSIAQPLMVADTMSTIQYSVGAPEFQPSEAPKETSSGTSAQAELLADASYPYDVQRGSHVYLGDTLVAFAEPDGLVVMDYHAAHERVNYERFLNSADMPSYALLFPAHVALPRADSAVLMSHRKLLAECGIDIEDFGEGSIVLRSIPEPLREADFSGLLSDIAASLRMQGDEPLADGLPELIDRKKRYLAAQLACHASIRGASESPDGQHLIALRTALAKTNEPHRCPHGRPTMIRFSLDVLKKMFKKS